LIRPKSQEAISAGIGYISGGETRGFRGLCNAGAMPH